MTAATIAQSFAHLPLQAGGVALTHAGRAAMWVISRFMRSPLTNSAVLALVVTTAMAYMAVRNRAIEQHREWMLRSYVVTFAFVVFRLFTQWLIGQGVSPSEAAGLMSWASWAVPLLMLEPMLQYRRIRRR